MNTFLFYVYFLFFTFFYIIFFKINLYAQVDVTQDTLQKIIAERVQKKVNELLQKKLDSLLKIKLDSLAKNTQKIPQNQPKTPPKPFQYRFLGDGFTMDGNVNRVLMTYRTELAYTKNNFQLESNPRFVYGEQNTNLAERDFFSDVSFNVFHNQKLYAFGLGTYEFSNLRGIVNRYLGGLGVGWRFLDKENFYLSLTNAIIYESTDFVRRTDFATWRNSTRIKIKYNLLQQHLRFTHYIFLQPSIQDADNFRWNINFLVEMPLYKGFSCRLSLDNFYESVVFDNRKPNDLTFRFGFSWGNRK